MTKREAKRFVLRCASVSLAHEIDNGSEWLERDESGKDLPHADYERVVAAVIELSGELLRRGTR